MDGLSIREYVRTSEGEMESAEWEVSDEQQTKAVQVESVEALSRENLMSFEIRIPQAYTPNTAEASSTNNSRADREALQGINDGEPHSRITLRLSAEELPRLCER